MNIIDHAALGLMYFGISMLGVFALIAVAAVIGAVLEQFRNPPEQ